MFSLHCIFVSEHFFVENIVILLLFLLLILYFYSVSLLRAVMHITVAITMASTEIYIILLYNKNVILT